MDLDLDPCLTVVSCLVDDVYQAQSAAAKPVRPGKAADRRDRAVLPLALRTQWHPSRAERWVGRDAVTQWQAAVPRLLQQRRFNRRMRDLHGVRATRGPARATPVAHARPLRRPDEVVDGRPVPVRARGRGTRHRGCAPTVGLGCGGRDRDWSSGVQLRLTVAPQGLLSGWTLGPAATAERWVADAVLRWRHTPQTAAPTVAALAPPLVGHDHPHRPRRGPTGPLGPAASPGHRHAAPPARGSRL